MGSFKNIFHRNKLYTIDKIDTVEILFENCPDIDNMLSCLIDEINNCNADKVVVISRFKKLSDFSQDKFPDYELLYNTDDYFGWLLKICEYSRLTTRKQILIQISMV